VQLPIQDGSHKQQQGPRTRDLRYATAIRVAFELFNTDKDGTVGYRKLKVALRALGFDLEKAEVLKKFKDLKADHGLLEYDDLVMSHCVRPWTVLSEKEMLVFILNSD
jgi:Ca2+-binding EF-hand superfamily protein